MNKEVSSTNPSGHVKKNGWTCNCCRHPVCWGVKGVILLAIIGGFYGLYAQSERRQADLKSLTQDIYQLRNGSVKVGLQEIDVLLSLATYDTVLFDSKSRLLEHLDQIARIANRLPKADAAPLQSAIAQDRQRLADFTPMNLQGVLEKIDAWIEQVDPLSGHLKETVPSTATPVAKEGENPKPATGTATGTATATEGESATSWPEKLQQGWEQLKGIVKIRRGDTDENVFVVSTQKWVVAEKLKMQLESLKLAAMSRDNALFQRLRLQAVHWLDTFYALNTDDSRQLRDGLMVAGNWDLSLKPFEFENVRGVLNNLRQQQAQAMP